MGNGIVKQEKQIVDVVAYDEIKEILGRKFESLDDYVKAIADLGNLDARLDIAKIQLRFLQGALVSSAGKQYGESVVEKAAEEWKMSVTTLREARRFAEALKKSPAKLEEWLADKQSQYNRVYWAAVQQFIRSDSDPKVLGPERLQKRVINHTEKLARNLEELNEALEEADDRAELEAELQGPMLMVRDELSKFSELQGLMGVAEKTPRSGEYLTFIRKFPCPVTGTWPTVAAHVLGSTSGKSIKASDFGIIPLDNTMHNDQHSMGVDSFAQKHDLDYHRLVANYLHRFITGQWLDMELGSEQE